jgi:hypothetical protein
VDITRVVSLTIPTVDEISAFHDLPGQVGLASVDPGVDDRHDNALAG